MDKVTVAGDVPRLVDAIVNVFIGIGVLVDDAVIAVMTPAIYRRYLCEEATVTVIAFEEAVASNEAKVLNVKVVFPATVILFLLF